MADYHSLLMRAVANLPNAGTPATREAIYVRARKALHRAIEEPASAFAGKRHRAGSERARRGDRPDRGEIRVAKRRSVLRSLAPRGAVRLAPGGKPGAAPPPSPKPGAPTAPAQPVAFQRPVTPGSPQSAPMAGVSRSVREPVATAVPSRVASAAGRIRSTVRSAANTAANHRRALGPSRPRRVANPAAAPAGKLAAAAAAARRRQVGLNPPLPEPNRRVIPRSEEQRHVLGDWDERRQRGQFPAAARSRQVGSVEVGG